MNWLDALADCEIRINEPMAEHTTFRVGGMADVFIAARGEDEIICALKAAREAGVPATVIGNGSNLLVRDGGIRGLVISIDAGMDDVRVNGETVIAQAGARLRKIAQEALAHSLTGLEFAAGIPGNLGGAVAMNAGAYGGEMAQVITRIEALDRDGASVILENSTDFAFGYRQSAVKRDDLIVLRASMALQKGDPAQIRDTMDDYAARRKASQPLDKPSAGSAFKRPQGHYAGRLIEDAGLKGTSVGGAQISPKHAGFIVNNGGATASDIERLILLVQERVFEASGITLEPEIRIIGERQ